MPIFVEMPKENLSIIHICQPESINIYRQMLLYCWTFFIILKTRYENQASFDEWLVSFREINEGINCWLSDGIQCKSMRDLSSIHMTSSNGNIFRVTGPLCGEFAGHRWIPPHKGQWRGTLMFSLLCAWINGWINNPEAGDLRRLQAHYDVIVMKYQESHLCGNFPSSAGKNIVEYNIS